MALLAHGCKLGTLDHDGLTAFDLLDVRLHDWAALVPVVEGAGGVMADWNGDPLHAGSDGHVLALGDAARLDDVVEALACNH